MPVPNYSVLKGQPSAGRVVAGRSNHYQITLQAPGGPFTVAVNIQSVDGSEVRYAILDAFQPPDAAALAALTPGIQGVRSQPGGLALDYVRSQVNGRPMITLGQMALLPKGLALTPHANPMLNAVDILLNEAVAAGNATIYAFGSAFSDRGRVDGIHNIHMNQGNPLNSFGRDNGVWQDGGLFLHRPAQNTWTAVLIAFQTQSWNTDDAGNPSGGG